MNAVIVSQESKLLDGVMSFGSDWESISLYCGFGFEENDYEERYYSLKSSAK